MASRGVRIGALVPGQFYNFRAVAVGAMESTPMFFNNLLASGDTTAPVASTSSVQAQHLREVTLVVATGSELDLAGYEFQVRSVTGGGGSLLASARAVAVKGGSTSKTLTVTAASCGSTLLARCRAKDHTGNPTDRTAGWSASASFVLARTVSDDYGDNSINTIKIIDAAISTGRIAIQAVSQSLIATTSGGTISTTATDVTAISQAITTAGGKVLVIAAIALRSNVATQRSAVTMRIRNATTERGQRRDIRGSCRRRPAWGHPVLSVPGLDSPSAGASTYVLEVKG